jgi:hypothetical protein
MRRRYDIIHLLSSLPSASSSRTTNTSARFGATTRNVQSINPEAPPSPTASSSSSSSAASWPDEPSDEEAFFDLSGDEAIAAYQKEKRRKWVEELRERRIRELDAEEEGGDGVASDEEEEQVSGFAILLQIASRCAKRDQLEGTRTSMLGGIISDRTMASSMTAEVQAPPC